MLGGVYLLMAVMLVLGTLMSRREPLARLLTASLAWIAIFAGGFVVFTFRDDLTYVTQRLKSEATGAPVIQGEEIRIPMAIDGHFWVDGRVNGEEVKFLVDSGATMTTVSPPLLSTASTTTHGRGSGKDTPGYGATFVRAMPAPTSPPPTPTHPVAGPPGAALRK